MNLYFNGRIFDGDTYIEAFVEENGEFVETGSYEQLKKQFPSAQEIDLQGNFVCAGFNDSHMHLLDTGYVLNGLELAKHTGSFQEMKEYIKDELTRRTLQPGEWLEGRGWNHDFFADGHHFFTRYDLDEITQDVPMCLVRACGHVCIVNSKALELIGVTKETPQVEGGQFDVDENGEPLGIFRENALNLVYAKKPQPSRKQLKQMLKKGMEVLNSLGVTSSQTDDYVVFQNLDYNEVIQAYQELEQEGEMTVRVYEQNHFTNPTDLQSFLDQGYNTGVGTDYFRFGPLKMLGDGSLGARTAFMSVPYADDPSTQGIAAYTQDTFDQMIGLANRNNMQVAIHSIGDGVLDMILNAVEKALLEKPREDHRHGIVHCQITREDQLERIARLNMHVYAQTIFLDYDIKIVEERIGKERAATSYNFKTLKDKGVCVSNGSDCPVELANALGGIQCAVTRSTLKEHIGPYLPSEAMSAAEAIRSFTTESAHASFEEDRKGRIAKGMLADFVVLSDDPMQCDPYQINDIQVLRTYVGGKQVYTIA